VPSATYDDTFKNRHWRVCTEVNGELESEGGNKVTYVNGRFTVDPPAGFSVGYLIQETDEGGADLPDSKRMAVGLDSLRRAAEEYGSITGLPSEDESGEPA
jgi:hypothetical protein